MPIIRRPRPESFPTPFQERWCWNALTLVAVVTVGAVIVGLIWLTTRILGFLPALLVPVAAAGIIAYLLDPLIKKLEARGTPSRWAINYVFVSSMAMVVVLGLSVAPAFIDLVADETGIVDKIETSVGNFVTGLKKEGGLLSNEKVKPVIESLQNTAKNPENWNWLKEQAPQIAANAWGLIGKSFGLFGYFIGFFLIPIYLYFFLREGQTIKKNWANYVPLRASKFKDEVVGVLQEINGYLIAFFRGQLLVSMIDGVLVAIGLSIIGLPYAIPIGAFVALLGLIPYIGNLMCLIPAVIISMSHFSYPDNQIFGIEQVWAYPLIVIGIFFFTQQLNSLVTAPKIVGDSVGLHPLTVIFSVLFWTTLIGGFLGSLLAVPLTASIKVLFRRYIWEMKPARLLKWPGWKPSGSLDYLSWDL
ncbi:MAG: AI-2E family transporter [Verrucomicrobiales bacterium]